MPTYSRATWRRLTIGLAAIAVLVAGALGVLIFARVGALHGNRYELKVRSNEARGLIQGSEVWLAGQKVGLVKTIGFRSTSTDSAPQLEVTLEVLKRYQEWIRADSRAQIRSGGSLIGAPVVWINVGTASAPMLRNGDSLPSSKQVDMEGIGSEVAIAGRDFPAIIKNIRTLAGSGATAVRAMTSVLSDRGEGSVTVFSSRASQLTGRAAGSRGTLALAMGDTLLVPRARRAMSRADSVLTLLGSSRTSLGRFRRDSSLFRTLEDTRNELSIVQARLSGSRGTAGRVLNDSAIVRQLARLHQEITRTMKDFKRDPARYIAF
ncbi:MAG: MlaD family protein [Gemmatimonadota bacterium]|nr:MlaD family protein [Gemmatimonadota bacterium]